MKKFISAALVFVLVFSFSACGKKQLTDEEIKTGKDNGTVFDFHCYYSVQNMDRTDDEILVHFPNEVYSSEKDVFYDENNETVIVFKGEKKFYDDKTGEEIEEKDLEYGQLLRVVYNGKAYDKDPVTIQAIKVTVCD